MTTGKTHEIYCIGEDRKVHVCLPWSNVTKCGIKVIRKIVTDRDYELGIDSCYECTY